MALFLFFYVCLTPCQQAEFLEDSFPVFSLLCVSPSGLVCPAAHSSVRLYVCACVRGS